MIRLTAASALSLLLGIVAATTTASAQTATYPARPVPLPDAEEIALAMSAAPAVISARASIYTVKDGKAVKIREGDNGAACMVARDLHPGSVYPLCYDAEASRTLLWRELMAVRLRGDGRTEPEVDRAIAAAYASGELRMPQSMAVVYMMSPRQVLFSSAMPDGRRVGAWWPHLMISAPGLTATSLGITQDDNTLPFSVMEENGLRQFVVTVPKWSDGSPGPNGR